jgi:hypothetical protein
MKSTETLQRETKMFRNILKTNKHVGRHYKYKQKMHSDITKKNKNAHMYYKDKHKWVEILQRQTKIYRDTTNTNTNE